jgi:uncharacterized RDD family membrane protein YckC
MATSEAQAQAQAPPAEPSLPFTPLPIAGRQFRVIAFILDCIVVASIAMLFFAVGGGQAVLRYDDPPDSAIYLMAYISLAVIPFTPLFFAFLWAWRSQSLGMMAVGIIVTTSDGYRISYLRAFARSFLWLLSMIPLGAGMIPIFFDKERRGLHDRLAGTVVRELR